MMGLPMVRHLAARHPGVTAFDQDPARRGAACEPPEGGAAPRVVSSLAGIEGSDVVVTMLPNGGIVRSVMLDATDAAALASRLAPGAVLVDMSSSDPADTRTLAADLAGQGIAVVDAPVSGSVAKAETGTLAIMIGGGDAAVAKARPILEAMGTTLLRTGPVGSAHAMKALNNYVYAAGLLAVCEAAIVAERMGLDLDILTKVLNSSSGRNIASETKLAQHILPGTYGGGFSIGLMAKDLGVAGAIAKEAGVHASQLELCLSLWRRALETVPASADNLELHRYLSDRAAGPPPTPKNPPPPS
jgi:3-hydroxyisobutyrate dehydrogenase